MLVFGGIPFDCVTTFFTFALVSSFAYGDGGTVELLLKVVGILIALLCVGVGKSFSITLVHPAQKLSNAKPCALDHPGLKKPTFCKSKRSPFWVFRHCETFFRNKKIDFFSKIVFFDVSGKSDFEFLWVSFRLVFGTVNLMKNFTIVYLSILKTLCPFVLPYFACKYRSWQTACFFALHKEWNDYSQGNLLFWLFVQFRGFRVAETYTWKFNTVNPASHFILWLIYFTMAPICHCFTIWKLHVFAESFLFLKL